MDATGKKAGAQNEHTRSQPGKKESKCKKVSCAPGQYGGTNGQMRAWVGLSRMECSAMLLSYRKSHGLRTPGSCITASPVRKPGQFVSTGIICIPDKGVIDMRPRQGRC
jgi:hypothetical protein